MTQHTELIDRLRGPIGTIPPDIQIEAANALEAQARKIAELKAQESELCTLYGLAQAECKKLRAEVEGLRKDAGRWRWATEQAEFFSMVVDGTGLHCAEVYEAESAVDAAIAMKGQP